jgi:hypothetical protein
MMKKNTIIFVGLAVVIFYAYRMKMKKKQEQKPSLTDEQKKSISQIVDVMKLGGLK